MKSETTQFWCVFMQNFRKETRASFLSIDPFWLVDIAFTEELMKLKVIRSLTCEQEL